MAEKRVGLSAVLKFAGDSAIAGMKKAGSAFKNLNMHAKQMKAGLQDIKSGLSGVGVAHAALAAGTGLAVKKFADFDGQMATVKAVMGEAQSKFFPALTAEAQMLGATTSFTAVEAAKAMENLARAGMRPKEVLASVSDVLAGAAADSIDLGRAAEIMVSAFAQFQLDKTKDSARVMDTLAYVSRNTKSDMNSLAEGMKFVGLKATSMNISFEDTIASLGALNDVGLDATLAGTALKNALVKIAANARNGFIGIDNFRFAIEKTRDGGFDLSKTMQNAMKQFAKIPDTFKRAQIATKLFGIRGEQAALAFGALSDEKTDILFNNLARSAKGTAKDMQRMQLDSLKGEFTLLSSAIDGVVTSFGAAVAAGLTGRGESPLSTLTSTIGSAAAAFQYFAMNAKAIGEDTPVQIEGVSREMMSFVRGVLRGIQDAKAMFMGMVGAIKRVAAMFGFSADSGSSSMARLVTASAGLALALAPIGLAIKGATMLFGPFAKAGVGAFKIVGGAAKTLAVGLSKVGGGILNKAGLAAKLPGAAKLLGGAVKAAENITAQSVRVVNFHEMPGGMGGLPGAPGTKGEGLAGSAMMRFRTNLASFVSRFGKTGKFLNSTFTTMGGSMASKVAKFAGAAAAAGAAGYAFGTWLDNKFGISDKLANSLHNLFNATKIQESKARVNQFKDQISYKNAEAMAQQFANLSQSGITSVGKKGKEKALTREFAESRISGFLKSQGKTDQEIKSALQALNSTLNGIRNQTNNTYTTVNLDGRKIGSAVSKSKIEGKERGARKPSRRLAAAGAAP